MYSSYKNILIGCVNNKYVKLNCLITKNNKYYIKIIIR